jgi:hypothetical protein
LVALEFELRALPLLDRCSFCLSHSTSPHLDFQIVYISLKQLLLAFILLLFSLSCLVQNGFHYVAQADLKLMVILPELPKC